MFGVHKGRKFQGIFHTEIIENPWQRAVNTVRIQVQCSTALDL